MPITVDPQTAERLRASIKRYFSEQLEQDIGDLKAGLLLDYALTEIGPVVYNRAVADAQAFVRDRLVDLENVCYEKEFTYWAATPTKRR